MIEHVNFGKNIGELGSHEMAFQSISISSLMIIQIFGLDWKKIEQGIHPGNIDEIVIYGWDKQGNKYRAKWEKSK